MRSPQRGWLTLLLAAVGGFLMFEGLLSVFGKLKNLVSVEAGGQRQKAGGDALQAGRDLIYNATPPPPPRPPWHLRDGAPTVGLSCGTNSQTRVISADLRFTKDVQQVEVRTGGFAGGERDWFVPGRANTTSSAMAFHVGEQTLPMDNDAIVEVETRFWWGDEQRHSLFRSTAGDVIANNTLGAPTHS